MFGFISIGGAIILGIAAIAHGIGWTCIVIIVVQHIRGK